MRRLLFIIAAAIMVVAMSVRTHAGINLSRIDDPDLRAEIDSAYDHRFDPPGSEWDGRLAFIVTFLHNNDLSPNPFKQATFDAYHDVVDSALVMGVVNRNVHDITALVAKMLANVQLSTTDPDTIASCESSRRNLYHNLRLFASELYGDTSYEHAEAMCKTAAMDLGMGMEMDIPRGSRLMREALSVMTAPRVISRAPVRVASYLTEMYPMLDYTGNQTMFIEFARPVMDTLVRRASLDPEYYVPAKLHLVDRIGNAYGDLGNDRDALNLYSAVLADTTGLDAEDRMYVRIMFLTDMGKCHANLGEYDEAISCHESAEKAFEAVAPDNWMRKHNFFWLANAFEKAGQTAKADSVNTLKLDLMVRQYYAMPDSSATTPGYCPTEEKAEAAKEIAFEFFRRKDYRNQKMFLDEAVSYACSEKLLQAIGSDMFNYYLYQRQSGPAMEWIGRLTEMAKSDPTGYESYRVKQHLAMLYAGVTIDPDLGVEVSLDGLEDFSESMLKRRHAMPSNALTTTKETLYAQWQHVSNELGGVGNTDGEVSALERCLHYMREFGDTVGDNYHYTRLQLIGTMMSRHFPWGDRPDSVQARLWCDRYRDYFLEHRREFADMPYLNPAGVGNNYYYAANDSATAAYWFDRQEEELRRDNPDGYRASVAYLDLLENRAHITTDQASRRQRYQTMLTAARAAGNSLKTKAALSGIITEFRPDPQTYRSALKEMIALTDTAPSASPYERAYLVSLAQSYYDCEMTDSLVGIYAEANDAAHKYLMHRFREAPADRRESMWQIYSQVPFGIGEELHETAPAAVPAAMVYDNILFRKGLLLNSSVAVENLIRTQGDSLLMAKFDRMTRLRNALKAGRDSVTDRDRTFPRKQAEALASRFESEAMERAAMLDDYTAALRCDHSQVQGALKPGDAAVEFTHYTRRDGSQAYAALVLKPEGAPRFVPLCPADSLADTGFDRYADLSAHIWGPLTADLKGVRNIYFSPDGILHTLPLECLPDPAQPAQTIGDTHACRRLSSTRTLVSGGRQATPSAISLYGGLRYDSPTDSLIADAHRYPVIATTRSAIVIPDDTTGTDRAAADSILLRSTMAYLPATKTEAENIARECHARDIDTRLLTAHNGTEASLKALSGRRLDILHLATHGFYWTERQAARLRRLGFLNTNSARTDEDNALARSGLLMAGANNALRGIALPAEVDDGIATAEEISRLDLRGLDMVVLSACQSGLGEVTGEGVFGLQRGFKKAGARSLLVSLWPVDDRATQMLMESFYRHYLSGRSKADALALARAELRAYTQPADTPESAGMTAPSDLSDQDLTPAQRRRLQKQTGTAATGSAAPDAPAHPYDAPRYWAAFVLVDALD